MALLESGPVQRGSETILLVEPEAETRTLAAFLLSRIGYRVLEAGSAGEACKIYANHPSSIDLLLTEAPMATINGHELARLLSAGDPRLRVLFLSDISYEKLARRAAASVGARFVHWPFTLRSLADKVRQALDAAPPRAVAHPAG
jgi:CheY-like chemotaxis protein